MLICTCWFHLHVNQLNAWSWII